MRPTILVPLLAFLAPALAARNPLHYYKRQSADAAQSPSATGEPISQPSASSDTSAASADPGSGTSTSSAAPFKPSTVEEGLPCTVYADCPTGSFCNQYGHGVNACLYYNDCRSPKSGGCPGGSCVQGDLSKPADDPDAKYTCIYPSGSSAPSTPASSAASVAPTSAPSGLPINDCRSTGCSHHEKCIPQFTNTKVDYICVDLLAEDCRTAKCPTDEFCSYFQPPKEPIAYVCLMNASFPAMEDCRVGGCPGGTCGYNGNSFQCYFETPSSSAPVSSASEAPSGSGGPSASASSAPSASDMPHPPAPSSEAPHPPASSSEAPHPPAPSSEAPHPPAPSSEAPHPPKESDKPHPPAPSSETPHPPAPSSDAPHPPKESDKPSPPKESDHPAPPAKSEHPSPSKSDTPAPPAKSDHPAPPTSSAHPAPPTSSDKPKDDGKGDNNKGCDLGGIYDLLWQIKGDLAEVKWELNVIKNQTKTEL